MKKVFIYFYVLLFLMLICGCGETEQQESNIMLYLEENAAISTFPLVIVISDKLTGDAFPEDIKRLCGLSRYTCKTLPVAGIVRLGQGIYYSYNSLGTLKINDSTEGNESALTAIVDQQMMTYHSKTLLKDYDSLLTPNQPGWNIKNLSLNYINNTTDSIFFFSAVPNSPAVVQVGNRNFNVYTNISDLRKRIDEVVCRGRATISVFYTPSPFDSSKVAVSAMRYPARGTSAGDTCIGYSKYERNHNGSGGFIMGNLIETNSVSCGYVFPTGVAGDTCVNGSKFQRLHNGRGGFSVGNLLERNSRSCGFTYPTGVAGDTCVNGSKFQRLHNGLGGFRVGNLLERNSRSCGFTYPTGVAGDTCVNGSKFQRLHNGRGGFRVGNLLERNSRSCGFTYLTGVAGDTCVKGSKFQRLHNGRGGFRVGNLLERNSKSCGFAYPARGIAALGYVCYNGSKYLKLHDGKGGYMRGNLFEANSADCGVKQSDNTCFSKSEPQCEQEGGSYTGRRVQYCYNRSGRIIQTIVLSKCDSDCRCLGR